MARKSVVDRYIIGRLECALLASGLVLTCTPSGLAAEKNKEEYDQGVAAYNKRDFSTASDLFWKSIVDGNGSASAWFYMAHSKAGEGRLDEARKDYQSVVKVFKDTPEAKAAAGYIKALDAKTWHPGPPPGSAAAAKVTSAKSGPIAAGGFRSRVEIITPRDGHPKVSPETIAAIRKAIDGLPKSIYKILDDGGAKVNIGPNMIDKWPNAINDVKPGQAQLTLAEEPGRTYGRDIHIYERSIVTQGSKELGERRPIAEIQANFLHEIGHAVDDCLGVYSKNRDLQSQYKIDCDSLDEEARASLGYYLQAGDAGPAEACAESVCVLLGGVHKETERFNRSFTRTESWVKNKLKL